MDAEGWLARERRKIELDTWTPPAQRAADEKARSIMLGEYADRWIENRNVKPRTRSSYRDILRLHIDPQLGRVPIKNLSGEAVRKWYTNLGNEHPRRNSHAYGLLHAVCTTAVSDGLIANNPCTIREP